MNENLRRINPVGSAGIEPKQPPTGKPTFDWVDPATLYIDPAYQRDIGERGLRQIRRIIADFDWAKFKPPICAITEIDGCGILKVVDGQHTAIAAASHPFISEIPVMLIEAPEGPDQARSFIGHNTARLGVTQLQLHQARLAAGDEDAQTIELVCLRAGITVLKAPYAGASSKPRETTAISTLGALITKNGVVTSRKILETLADAELGPLTSPQIKAVELLLTDEEFSGRITAEDLTSAMVDLLWTAEDEAKRFAATHKMPYWRALANIWFQKCRKRRIPVARQL